MESLTLDIAGICQYPDYEKKLRDLAGKLGIAERVRFLGPVPRNNIAAVYREHDVLVFPSEWEEPFAITPLEAITAGMAVVGTTTGGSGELFRDRETAIVFETGNAQACADAIRRLADDRQLFETLRANAAREVAARHTLDGMVNAIEKGLLELLD
jgi:glycosyltransferase involved in cell wall biosynthesis